MKSGTRFIGDDLIERDSELAALAGALAALEDRVGRVVTVKAPAGLGKTTLLERAIAGATRAGYRVRRAAPGPQERHFAYGVMRTLLEAPVHDADKAERSRLLDGVAGQAGDLLLSGTRARLGRDDEHRAQHAVVVRRDHRWGRADDARHR